MLIEIYKITNNINGKKYVGQTRVGIYKRFSQHTKSDTIIGKAIRRYGEDNFTVECIDIANSIEEANCLENSHIVEEDCVAPKGYNYNELGRIGVSGEVKTISHPYFVFFRPSTLHILYDLDSRAIVHYIMLILRLANRSMYLVNREKRGDLYYISTVTKLCEAINCSKKSTRATIKKLVDDNNMFVYTKVGGRKAILLNKDIFKIYY